MLHQSVELSAAQELASDFCSDCLRLGLQVELLKQTFATEIINFKLQFKTEPNRCYRLQSYQLMPPPKEVAKSQIAKLAADVSSDTYESGMPETR
ncbi:uncharacterized protein A4U43_C07F1400 [Asparagus officinalis]|uniref:Uncharacterized protein n=1 Tax=Asparagus officinalis TaxID=4686 RepID=A0A5P1EBN1_ASPOF|nr:uncharacterized protein A4U43_C07F1400 [Asparagus officinalis]